MPTSSADRNPVDQLAEEFAERYRRGERPSLAEYVEKYPKYADAIRELFPALVVMEQLKPDGDATGACEGPPAPAEGRAPERLGDYRILREVGRGGMGVVYEAEQVSLGRHVALKVLPPQALLNPTYLERFRREAKAAARLHHTNIVPVFGVGEEDGVHFYAMQFIRGEGLDHVLHDLRRLRGAPGGVPSERSVAQSFLTGQFAEPPTARAEQVGGTPVAAPGGGAEPKSFSALSSGGSEAAYYRSAARVGLQVADALSYAHRQGVVHRDVKPSNLLLDAQGTVWVTDFGLAKAEGSDDLTHSGDIVGTMRFMAPERFDGRSLPQSDVYGLGLTLYELLTLRPAFDDTNKGRLIDKVLHEPPAPPRRLDPRVPRDLETVVLKCLAKDPAERYPTAEALAEDLRRFLADRPIKARRAGNAERLWRWARRNPAVASLLACVALLLVAVAVVSAFSAVQLNDALGQTRQAEREARLREAEALVGQAHGIRNSRRPGQRFEALAALKKAAVIGRELGQPPEWFDRLRNEAIAALALPDIHITQSWDGFPQGTHRADVGPDFEIYARTTREGGCSVRRVADDVEIARLPELGEPASVTVGPGRNLVLSDERCHKLQYWDLSGSEPACRFELDGFASHHFRPDGRLLAVTLADGSLCVYETGTGACRYRLAANDPAELSIPCLHPTEPIVALSCASGVVRLRDLETGEVFASFRPPSLGMSDWAPDGRTLAVSEGDSGLVHLYAFDPTARTVRPTRVLRAPGIGGTRISFNPAGDRLVSRGWNNIVHLFDVRTGRLLFSTHSLLSTAGAGLRFDSSGERLAAARVGPRQERVGVWSVADGREYRALAHDGSGRWPDCYGGPAVHPGGRLAALGLGGGLALFDVESDRELAIVSPPGGGGNPCFDGDGNLLFACGGGLLRWAVRPDLTQPGRLTLGPPQRLPFPSGDRSVAASRDGRVIAQAIFGTGGGWVQSADAPQPRRLEPGGCNWCSVSLDGRWVAFGPHVLRVNVYEVATGRLAFQSPADEHAYCRFSPDGRWLLTENDGGRAYAVGTWEPGPRLGPGVPWDASPDGRVAVVGLPDGVYRLVELATGRELARLEDPDQIYSRALFSGDGTRLVVSAEDGLRVWDLRRILLELTQLGLDWDAPAYRPAEKPAPLTVRVNLGGLEDDAALGERPTPDHLRALIAANSFALAANPFDYKAFRQRGRAFGLLREPRAAIADYSTALAMMPSDDLSRADLLCRRATNHLALQELEPALDDFRRAEAFDPALVAARRSGHARELNDRAIALKGRSDFRGALRLLRQAVQIAPGDAFSQTHLAWVLVIGPEELRDPAEALRHAQAAVVLEPNSTWCTTTLALAQFRAGRVDEALPVLEKNLALEGDGDRGVDGFFLAMCHARLGDRAKARDNFDRAVKWLEARKDLPPAEVVQLGMIRAEAEAVLRAK
jgi:serine/threonine protein kinase/WD40 repeat protein